MHVTKVGEQFISGKINWTEGAYFEYAESGPYLIFAFRNPSKKEIEGAREGKVELALYEAPPILWILHRVHGIEQWSDNPFNIRHYDGKGNFDWSEPIEEGKGIGLNIMLVEAGTGILLVQRLIGLSTKFSIELREAILRQLEQPFSLQNFNDIVKKTYSNFTSKELLQRASIMCRVGE
jgi:hypothetical protein